jgi:hypothetical protein
MVLMVAGISRIGEVEPMETQVVAKPIVRVTLDMPTADYQRLKMIAKDQSRSLRMEIIHRLRQSLRAEAA